MVQAEGAMHFHVRRIGRAAATLTASSMGSFANLSTLIIYPFGVLALAMSKDLGWPKQLIAAMIGPALLVTIVMQPVVGWAVNRFSKRLVAIGASLGLGCGLALLAFSPADRQTFSSLLFGAVALGCFATPTVYSALVAETFEARRGLALGVMMAFTGLGVAAIPPTCAFIASTAGWRAGFGAMAASAFVVALIEVILLPPEQRPAHRMVEGREARAIVLTAMRGSRFWKIAAICFLIALAANAVPLYLPLILEDRGASASTAALSLSAMGVTMVIGRPIIGFLLDHLPVRYVLTFMLLGPLAGSIGLVMTASAPAALAAATGFGLAIGGEFVCLGFMISRSYELQNFGAIYGWVAVALAAGVAGGPIAISALLHLGRGYLPSLLMTAGCSLVAILIALTLKDADFRRALHTT